MNDLQITELFQKLHDRDILCWGTGKHFKYVTRSFLIQSGLIGNVKGFLDTTGKNSVMLDGRSYPRIAKDDLAQMDGKRTVLLIAVTGYREVLDQIAADPKLSRFTAIPSIYLEALYEDLRMLQAPKPPAGFRRHDEPVIPKVIHTFWFSGEELPGRYRACLNSWKKYAPDYEIKIWDLDSYQPKDCLFFEQAVQRHNWAFASDYARADVLRRYGGVYMDLDVEMLRPIDELLYNDAYMSFESTDRIECGSGMGAVPGNRILNEICESYESSPFIREDGTEDLSTCPVRYTRVIEKHGLIKNGGFQFVDDITIYPFEVLTAKSFDSGIIYRTDHSFTIHHHHGNWVPGSAKDAMEERYEEIRKFLQEEIQ